MSGAFQRATSGAHPPDNPRWMSATVEITRRPTALQPSVTASGADAGKNHEGIASTWGGAALSGWMPELGVLSQVDLR
jgi:hypothetical protein